MDALESGDTGQLLVIRRTLEKAPGPEPAFNVMLLALCDAAIARTQGNLPRSDHLIQDALRRAAPWSNPAQSINPFNFMLATFLTGNLLLENRLLYGQRESPLPIEPSASLSRRITTSRTWYSRISIRSA
ncbi:hypothetical protein [Asaia platycodi]|uniref:hypothetical protein n=1 Tax=Asaia platycodi TaxID=610243 RepID=UPI000A870B72|nr:hypothetical protein [Asaia platycodi]